MEKFGVANLYEWLQQIRKRPGMYVHDKSLSQLETLCHGYCAALAFHCLSEFGTDFNERFRTFLYKRKRWGMALGWAKAIQEHSDNDDEAFDRFFELLEKFKAAPTK